MMGNWVQIAIIIVYLNVDHMEYHIHSLTSFLASLFYVAPEKIGFRSLFCCHVFTVY